MAGLTHEQLYLLDYIKDFIHINRGVSPSYQEMMIHLGLKSKSGICRLVDCLEERGHIKRHPNMARSIEVIDTSIHPNDNNSLRHLFNDSEWQYVQSCADADKVSVSEFIRKSTMHVAKLIIEEGL